MKPLVTFPDPQRYVVDYLSAVLSDRGETANVAAEVPDGWAPKAGDLVVVEWDGSLDEYPVLSRATVRVTTWCKDPTRGKSLAGVCRSLLLSHPGGGGVANIRSLTGVLPARDPRTRAYLASVTVAVNLRAVAL